MSSNQMFPGWSTFQKLLTKRLTLLSRVTFQSGKIRREIWWSRVLKVHFCNFDCFHSKTKMEPPKKGSAYLTEDETGELLVEKESKNTQNGTRAAVSTLRAFCDETEGEFDFERAKTQ